MNDSRPMNETYPSLPFENSIHNPFLNHISSFRAFKSPRVVRKEAAKDWKSYYFLLPYPLPHAPFISLFNKQIVLFQDLKKRLGLVLGTTKSLNRGSHSKSSGGRNGPSTSSNDLLALLALPDTDASSLDGVLSAESAGVTICHYPYTHTYVPCWLISIFLTILRREEPYLVPYFPQIPTFLVLLPYDFVSFHARLT